MSVPPLDRIAQLLQPGGNEAPKPDKIAGSCKSYASAAHKSFATAKRAIEKITKHDTTAGREADIEQAAVFSSLAVINGFSALVRTFEHAGQPYQKAVQSAYAVLNRHHAALKDGAAGEVLDGLPVADLFGWETPQKEGGSHDGK